MALYYSLPGNSDKELHVGNKDGIGAMNADARFVTEVQADGHELQAIKDQFVDIPMSRNRVVTWYGDHAKFIAKHFR